jgi:Ca2+-binding RTX toxin-like protein
VTTDPATGVSSITTIEGGTVQTVSAVLGTRPTSDVTLNLVSTNTTEGTVSVPALTFTPENWDVPQIFTIIPGDDAIADGTIPFTIITTFTSTDPVYSTLNPADISVSNFDNEVQAGNTPPTVPTIAPPALVEGGIVAITGLAATDPDGIGFYTITTIPAASQGTLYLGDPTQTGVPVTAGQNLTPTQIGQLFFRAGTGFSGTNFTYTATDSLGATSDPRTVSFAVGNTPPTVPTIAPPALVEGGIVAITGLAATDSDGIGFYTITTIPAASQGTLYLGDPTQTGVPVTAGQNLTPTQIGQLFFRAGTGFSGTNFTYTATDNLGATSDPRTVSFAVGSEAGSGAREDVCIPGTPINGTKGNNKLDGVDGVSDTIFGKDGNDRLRGFGCEDLLDGGAGNDRLLGGTDKDTLRGRIGNDTLVGGAASDVLNGGLGSDRLEGGEGDDILKGRRGLDLLIGGTGNDVMSGGRRNDRLRGGSGDDTVDGGQGDDVVKGGSGNDILTGRTGRDTLVGLAGDDTISGGLGHDLIIGGAGADLMRGNRGRDVFEYRSLQEGGDTITDFAANRDSINLRRISLGRSFSNFVTLSQSGSNTLVQVANGSSLTTLATLTDVTASTLGAGNFVV